MKKNIKSLILFFLVVTMTGCAAWSQLKKVEYVDDSRLFSSVVPMGWMRFNLGKEFLITRDGTVLNVITVSRAKIDQKLAFTKKKFSEDMLPQNLAEVEVDDIRSCEGINRFELLSNKPATLDGRPGFRIEYHFYTQGGLKIKGVRLGFIEDKRISRIRYEAASQHYFDHTQNDFKTFIDNFKVVKK